MEKNSLIPRDYQSKILETCLEKDCLVVLPTGTGKTLIALLLAKRIFQKAPLTKILILAPTRPLIEQHYEYFKKNLPEGFADMQIFTGKTESQKRREIWKTAEFIFSTPQCIANDLENNLYALDEVSLLIVDECHRCLKNYAYNRVLQKYKEQNQDGARRKVLGLTASPGSDKETIARVCENLGIEAVEIRTRESPDVKPYLQELEFEKIEVAFPQELEEIRIILTEIYNKKIQELKNRKVLFGYASKTALLALQSRLMKEILRGKDFNKMLAVSVLAQAIKLSHALELLETQTISSFTSYLKDLYNQAQAQKSKGVQKLVKDPLFSKAYTLATTLLNEHPKINELKRIVTEQLEKNSDSKIIVFAQYRETVLKISETLKEIKGAKVENFVGQAIKEHQSGKISGLNQKEQKKVVENFKEGKVNILVATSIAEEGLDIPEVNQVIFYEPIPSAIRTIQRAGRTARLAPGSLKILMTKNTRDIAHHYASHHKEVRMHKAIDQIKEEFNSGDKQEKLT